MKAFNFKGCDQVNFETEQVLIVMLFKTLLVWGTDLKVLISFHLLKIRIKNKNKKVYNNGFLRFFYPIKCIS